MKRNLLFTVSIAVSLLAGSFIGNQTEDKSLARVQRVQGKYVFFMSEPVGDYESVMNIKPPIVKIGDTDPDALVTNMINRVNKKMNKKGTKWDAIITKDGLRGIAIKFTD